MIADGAMRRTRVLVCDDSPELRELVSGALARNPALEVVATAGDAAGVARAAADSRPDVVVLDLLMPGAPPDMLVLAVAASAPRSRIAVFSGRATETLGAAARAAVAAHVDKTTPLDVLARRVAELGERDDPAL
jgi:two-component system, chemotaxis family, protein-glutamate methylesterase/glutaminase